MKQQITQEAVTWYNDVDWQGVIDRIATGLGTTGEYLWSTLVDGMFIEGVAGLTMGILSILVGIPMVYFGIKLISKTDFYKDPFEDGQIFKLIGGVFIAFFGVVSIVNNINGLEDDIMKVGVPEYKALQFIMSEAKK